MADLSMETLYHPPFENDPPVKLNISAKTLGLVLAILYAIFALFSLIGIVLHQLDQLCRILFWNERYIVLIVLNCIQDCFNHLFG